VNSWILSAEPANRPDRIVCTSACDHRDVCELTSRLELLAFNIIQQVLDVVAVIVASYADRNIRCFFPLIIDFSFC